MSISQKAINIILGTDITPIDSKSKADECDVHLFAANKPIRLQQEDTHVETYQKLSKQIIEGDLSKSKIDLTKIKTEADQATLEKMIRIHSGKNTLFLNASHHSLFGSLVDMLEKNVSIHNLDIPFELSIDEIILFANALKVNTTLEYLTFITFHNLGDVGCAIIAEALKHNKSLKEVVIDCKGRNTKAFHRNTIGDLSAMAFSETLKENKTLKKLRFIGCHITELGAEFLSHGLIRNETLNVLDLSDNCFHPSELGLVILRRLCTISRLIKLGASHKPAGTYTCKEKEPVTFQYIGQSFITVQNNLSIISKLPVNPVAKSDLASSVEKSSTTIAAVAPIIISPAAAAIASNVANDNSITVAKPSPKPS